MSVSSPYGYTSSPNYVQFTQPSPGADLSSAYAAALLQDPALTNYMPNYSSMYPGSGGGGGRGSGGSNNAGSLGGQALKQYLNSGSGSSYTPLSSAMSSAEASSAVDALGQTGASNMSADIAASSPTLADVAGSTASDVGSWVGSDAAPAAGSFIGDEVVPAIGSAFDAVGSWLGDLFSGVGDAVGSAGAADAAAAAA